VQDKQKRRRLGDRVFRVPRVRPWSVALPTVPTPKTGAVLPLIKVSGNNDKLEQLLVEAGSESVEE